MNRQIVIVAAIVAATIALGFGLWSLPTPTNAEPAHAAESAQFERGPHRGRMLREGNFAIEVTIFEDNVPPEYRLYAYEGGKPVQAKDVQASITLGRLDGEKNVFRFAPAGDFLRGDGVVTEPHSFDVAVAAGYKGRAYAWSYASYEGRTSISAAAAMQAGVMAEAAGPGVIASKVPLTGRIVLDPRRAAQVRPRFTGVVREVRKSVGDLVNAGDILAVIESNESLQPYQLRAPIAGRITRRAANTGETAGEAPLFEIADTREVIAEFNVFPRHFAVVREGQTVSVRALESQMEYTGTLEVVSIVADPATQTVLVRARIPNPEGMWRPGIAVAGSVIVAERAAALVVRNSGLQTFRDFTVVYAKVGDTYEVRMLELGETDGEFTEVMGGLKLGTEYVSENSFLIKADIEKSGASHDH